MDSISCINLIHCFGFPVFNFSPSARDKWGWCSNFLIVLEFPYERNINKWADLKKYIRGSTEWPKSTDCGGTLPRLSFGPTTSQGPEVPFFAFCAPVSSQTKQKWPAVLPCSSPALSREALALPLLSLPFTAKPDQHPSLHYSFLNVLQSGISI